MNNIETAHGFNRGQFLSLSDVFVILMPSQDET